MPYQDNWARDSDTAQYLLVMRKKQISYQEEMRKKGIEPEPKKEEVSLLDRLTSKVSDFFKPSKKNKYNLIKDNHDDNCLND